MAQDSGAQRRTEAAALKAQADKQAARDKRTKWLGGIAVAAVAIGIVAAGYLGAKSAEPSADANAKSPKGVTSTYGLPMRPIDSAKSTLVIYEDPQCPICKLFEQQYGEGVRALVTSGKINLVYQMATFIDDNLPQSNQASRRSIAGLGCAVDQGKGIEYHDLIFANQPATEGDGFTDELLRELGSTVGLKGAKLNSFQSCFDDGTYLGWADNANQYFRDQGIPGTPNLVLDGTTVPDSAMSTIDDLVAYINKNAK